MLIFLFDHFLEDRAKNVKNFIVFLEYGETFSEICVKQIHVNQGTDFLTNRHLKLNSTHSVLGDSET